MTGRCNKRRRPDSAPAAPGAVKGTPNPACRPEHTAQHAARLQHLSRNPYYLERSARLVQCTCHSRLHLHLLPCHLPIAVHPTSTDSTSQLRQHVLCAAPTHQHTGRGRGASATRLLQGMGYRVARTLNARLSRHSGTLHNSFIQPHIMHVHVHVHAAAPRSTRSAGTAQAPPLCCAAAAGVQHCRQQAGWPRTWLADAHHQVAACIPQPAPQV